jgi:peptide chain release factor 1
MADIEELKSEYEELLQQLSNPELISDWEKFERLQKRKGLIEKIIEKEKEIKEIKNRIEENREILKAKEDPELISLAETEIKQLQEKEKVLEKEIKNLPNEGNKAGGSQAVIVEIRAGTGGQEACLFAGDLFRMYSKYGQNQGWQQKILDSHPTELGGFKEIIFEFKNGDIFSKVKYEGGVHRVQRIPETEKGGRVHTSTSSVAILRKPRGAQVKIKPEDLKIDFYKASGPGGQYVNKRMTAVRITHLPTSLVVTSQTERNQLQNKENALAILEARLLERKEMAETEQVSGERKAQIGGAKRAEKIRTYNFPQDRLTDHRIKKSWHNIEKIMAGNLNPIISALTKSEV